MSFGKNELRNKVYSLFTGKTVPTHSCREIAQLIRKNPKDLNQVLKKLVDLNELTRFKEKKNVGPTVYLYTLPDNDKSSNAKKETQCRKKVCQNCQRYSGLQKCILLELVNELAPWALQGELKEKFEAINLQDVPGCEFFDLRVKGQNKRRTMSVFLKENTDSQTFEFRCPIERCNKIIDELSNSIQIRNIGSNTLYCPHCGGAMRFRYNDGIDRYEAMYYDCKFDNLQRDLELLTGYVLESRYDSERPYGMSITKENSFHIDKRLEIIYVGNDLTPENFNDSDDLACFSLRELDYIAVKYEPDYVYLKKAFHAIDEEKLKPLYTNINLLFSGNPIESVEPTLPEIGGNEIIITTGVLFHRMFLTNALDSRAVFAKITSEMVDVEFKENFRKALAFVDRDIKHYTKPWDINYLEWMQKEGGIASLMQEPLRLEAEKYGFENISRKLARLVRWEPYMKYSLFAARTPKACFKNAVNKLIDNHIKKEIYNKLEFPWDGLRGWCHRKYPNGLFMDTNERNRAIATLWIHEAIRNEEITPNDFEIERGKRYEKYYTMNKDSHAFSVAKRVFNQTLNTKCCLTDGFESTNKRLTEKTTNQLKGLLNGLSNSSVELIIDNGGSGQVKTIWKKLQEERDKSHLTRKEFQALHKYVRKFLRDEFSFETFTIEEIL